MNLQGIDLNLLVALDALLAEESVSGAAKRLHIGQPAMSATLQRLRRLFGDPIFIKRGRGLAPTPFAKSLTAPLRETLQRVESLLASGATFTPAADNRDFSITTNDYVAAVFLRPLMVRLAVEAPHVKLHIQPVRDDFTDRIRRGETDLLILPKDVFPQYRDFPHKPLFSDRYVCAVDASNPDVKGALTLAQVSAQPYAAVNVGMLPSSAEMQLDSMGIVRNTQITIETFTLAPFILRGTRLLSLIQERLALALNDRGTLRLIEPPMPLQPLKMIMLWSQQNAEDPGHQWLRQRLSSLAAELFASHHSD